MGKAARIGWSIALTFGIAGLTLCGIGTADLINGTKRANELLKSSNGQIAMEYYRVYDDLDKASGYLGEYVTKEGNEKDSRIMMVKAPDLFVSSDYLKKAVEGVYELDKRNLQYPEGIFDVSDFVLNYEVNEQDKTQDLEELVDLKNKVTSLKNDFKTYAEKYEPKIASLADKIYVYNDGKGVIYTICIIPTVLSTVGTIVSARYLISNIKSDSGSFRRHKVKKVRNKI